MAFCTKFWERLSEASEAVTSEHSRQHGDIVSFLTLFIKEVWLNIEHTIEIGRGGTWVGEWLLYWEIVVKHTCVADRYTGVTFRDSKVCA
jgi:hypothetical protein